jgi:hypothetical protein
MRNCIILGSGRSGTSMVAGTLAKAGYFMGENLIPAREANSKGFFEDVEVNMINEDLLAPLVPQRVVLLGQEFFRPRPLEGQRWLAYLPLGTRVPRPSWIASRIEAVTRRGPYCFKDPRFCYTLPAWRPFLKNAVFVCVFRDPSSTAASILKECHEASYLQTLSMTSSRALKIWNEMYLHVLRTHRREGDWLFLHYDQVVGGDGLSRLEKFVEAPVDVGFPEAALRRSYPADNSRVPKRTRRIYQELCDSAGYRCL